MKLGDLLYETWYALAANKGRSFLTILGIVIGISAVIAMTSLIGGIQNTLMGELGFAQARQVAISVNSPREITFDDLDALEQMMPDYEFITGSTQIGTTVGTATTTVENSTVYCVKPEYFVANGSTLAAGRFFTESEEKSGARYVLIDQNSIKEVFGSAEAQAIGQTIRLGNDDYQVIGVLQSSTLMSYGTTIYVPFSTAVQRLGAMGGYMQITGFVREGADIETVVAATTSTVARYFGLSGEEDVYVFSFDSIIKEMETTMASFSLLMGSVASISLFVGGVGIMNMMLTNVTERIREIGLRKSLGARRRDITKQFLLEAIMLCVIGGVIGIVIGLLGAWGLGAVVGAMQPGMTVVPAVSLPVILGAVGVCVLIGIVFGYYPARRAAKLDPVESLRYQ
ncbi:ABC transporter permease [Raoultibacter massiliensis]|uniref:ABC transporter permease n=1 Tax=Raoultibacter massiliensis TaxID=1852371 RepID=A0ABV1J8H1_9ACTN|nr:ABC transporter permease [Raoultibacter massiliensis]